MTSEHWTDRLSDYLDGEMETSERAVCHAHLDECVACSRTLDELRFLKDQAGLLPDVPPARDMWPDIEARLAPRGTVPGAPPAAGSARSTGVDPADRTVIPLSSRRRVAMTIPQLIAAAVALALFSVGAFQLILPSAALTGAELAGSPSAGAAPAVGGTGEDASRAGATPVLFTAAYDDAIAELEAEFERRRPDLDPETARVVAKNLAIIDRAIAEASSALAEDPSSGFLNAYMAGAMRQKVDLLRRAAGIEQTEI